jgi:catechol 2,3-dioxygenase
MVLPAQTTVGPVVLTVANLARSVGFYEGVLGLAAAHRDRQAAVLAAGDTALVGLLEAPGARPPARRATGLYHLAILMPSRPALARALARLLEARYPIQGASDHLVSEAIYLADPDGHGIELYADRPRDRWPRRGEIVQMATDPLDLGELLGEAGPPGAGGARGIDPAARIGHVHLRVADLGASEAFYHGVLGFEVMQRDYPGALFVAAGGYHHHIGLNIWGSAGAPPPPPDALALRWFAIRLPDDAALGSALERVRAASMGLVRTDAGWLMRDPSQNAIILASGGMGIAATTAAVPLGADRVAS